MHTEKNVLIVDDSRISRMMIKAYVLSLFPSWTIVEASTGEEAIEKAPALHAPLIMMDVNMPGMGGLAAAEKLRKLCPDAHISLLTANVQDATRNKAQLMGVGFMEKPITEARIHQLIAAWAQ
jgi:CheY-like chemotaxis protein